MKNWYTIQTKPRQEDKARHNLQRQGFETYLPQIRLKKRRRKQWADVLEPLFPRYLFIHADSNQQSLAPVRSTLGVSSLVRFGNVLRPVPDPVIAYLKQAEQENTGQHGDSAWPFKEGDEVAVLEGPFAGLNGLYQMPVGQERALLLITLLGRENAVEVPHQALASP
jgi:transcriptional antiterminator RfaH